ncbi:MAG: heavy metal translocating P-type ATPase [Candidatus Izemoplasmatales bacterium]|nr:heavy metal translocating P-type ATPase [Candidatus Izemoplasmatales bacterium]MDD5601424.1 heavy metal translocating P-type ATPase [Candidatus Izemoplasmatales bacterium]MDY0372711.1 heavy metal translocating P-type ATPase [Candidatus Izemoplasmatales bacterium]
MIRKILMKNLTCSNCIAKIERRAARLPYVNSASFNFANQTLLVDFSDDVDETLALKEIKAIVDVLEDNIVTQYVEQKIEEKKIHFLKEYLWVLIGMGIIFFTFSAYRIPIWINSIFGTNFELWPQLVTTILYWVGYVLLISKLLLVQIKGIRNFNFFNESTLMIIATFAAMFLGKHEESIAVVILYSIGEYLQSRAVQKSKNEIASLIDLKVDYANVLEEDKIIVKDPLQVKVNDILVIKKGERVPLDGIVCQGSTSLNTSELTGETKLLSVDVGSPVLSGHINVGNIIHLKATKEYHDSTLARIIDLIENSTTKKSKTELFITKFARIYTPIVVALAGLLVLYGILFDPNNVTTTSGYIYRAAIFLVISCPCSLVLSVPLSYYAGIGTAAKNGILFKGSAYLQTLTDVKMIALDKTGTLTYGAFFVQEYTNQETLRIAASIEKYSSHPIAQAIVEYNQLPLYDLEEVEEIAGYGIKGIWNGKTVLAGSRRFLESYQITISDEKLPVGSYTFVSVADEYLGYVIVKDELKETSMDTVRRFTKQYDTLMLTGDNEDSAYEIATKLGGIEYYSELLPEQKLTKFDAIRTNSVSLYVGDGINDAPLLKNADIGVSMGSASDLAIEVADIIIMNNDIRLLEKAIRIAKKTRLIATENIVLSMIVKLMFLALSAAGLMWMWLSIFADVGIALLCVLNALRIVYQKKYLEILPSQQTSKEKIGRLK